MHAHYRMHTCMPGTAPVYVPAKDFGRLDAGCTRHATNGILCAHTRTRALTHTRTPGNATASRIRDETCNPHRDAGKGCKRVSYARGH